MEKPTPNTLDLDALEREGRPNPLTLTYKGQRFAMVDPLMLPYEVYVEVDWTDPREALKTFLADQYEAFMKLEPTAQALHRFSAYVDDYYVGTTPGEAGGSSTS